MKRKMIAGGVFFVMTLSAFAATAGATTINFAATSLGGDQYEYRYTLSNDTLGFAIEEFTIFFDRTLYADLQLGDPVANWDLIVIQPDFAIPDDGFFDALTLGAGIAPDQVAGGFSVIFTWLGTDLPGAQPFDVVDPISFATLDNGTTSAVIPLPASLLLLLGAIGLLPRRR